jgi:hypothetical protein
MDNKQILWLQYLRQTEIQYLLAVAAKEINYIRNWIRYKLYMQLSKEGVTDVHVKSPQYIIEQNNGVKNIL